MPLACIRNAERLSVGINQTTKALGQGLVRELFLARDADARMLSRLIALANQHDAPIVWVETMKQLGEHCGIQVGAVTAAIVEK